MPTVQFRNNISNTKYMMFVVLTPKYYTHSHTHNMYPLTFEVKLKLSYCSRIVRLLEFVDSRHTKVLRLSALRTCRLYPQGTSLALISVRGLIYSRIGRIKAMKNSINAIGNRACDLPACSEVPEPTTPPRNT